MEGCRNQETSQLWWKHRHPKLSGGKWCCVEGLYDEDGDSLAMLSFVVSTGHCMEWEDTHLLCRPQADRGTGAIPRYIRRGGMAGRKAKGNQA